MTSPCSKLACTHLFHHGLARVLHVTSPCSKLACTHLFHHGLARVLHVTSPCSKLACTHLFHHGLARVLHVTSPCSKLACTHLFRHGLARVLHVTSPLASWPVLTSSTTGWQGCCCWPSFMSTWQARNTAVSRSIHRDGSLEVPDCTDRVPCASWKGKKRIS